MANTREIKNRIKSVGDTQKITNAMYLISSTKMRKARKDAESVRPYYELLRREIHRIFALGRDIRSRYFSAETPARESRVGILVITADKGLAGAYNQSVIKETLALMDRCDDTILYIAGEYGWRYFHAHNHKVSETFIHSMEAPTLAVARLMTTELLEAFDNGDFDRLYVCYTDYEGGMSAGEAAHFRLLPFERSDFVPQGDETDPDASTVFEYVPDAETVLESIIPSYMTGYIYSALVNSYSAEQCARMMAMDAANDNAISLLDELTLEYNHVRQNAITQEITEISSGARSLRKKKG